jgi:ATP-dependent DNA helicase RecQ
VDIVTGSANKKIRDFGHDRLKTYGVGKGRDKKFWRQLIDELLAQKVIAKSEGLYPTIVLLPKAVQILKNEARVEIVRVLEKKSAKAGKQELSGSYDHELFDQLRELRKQIADEQGIPPYVVFSDRTLRDMASIFPENNEAMLSVSGVGEVKLDRYGRQFLNLINRYRSDHPERNALS